LQSLLDKIRKCQLCAEKFSHEPKPVLQYHTNSRILIAGQAPGKRVHESGIPFDDVSGERLRDWLGLSKSIFYDEKKVAILPMAFCYPGTSKTGDLRPPIECAQAWRKPLLNGLGKIKLTIILGKYALDYHSGKKQISITNAVQSWQEFLPDYFVLPHPSPRNNIWLNKNPWFVKEVIPVLRSSVNKVLNADKE
jgi:uracil-DNA glycosylase